jgi:hypothetical protein
MVAPLSSTAVYSVLVSAFMARGAILFKLQSKVFQDMLSRGDLTYMGAVSRIADFRATVRVGWLAVPQHASLWFARVVGTSCFVRCWCALWVVVSFCPVVDCARAVQSNVYPGTPGD